MSQSPAIIPIRVGAEAQAASNLYFKNLLVKAIKRKITSAIL